jgi:hypothetical protein
MLGNRVGLADLVESARDRLLGPGEYLVWMETRFYHWVPGTFNGLGQTTPKTPADIADEVVLLAREEQYGWARKVSVLHEGDTLEQWPWDPEPEWQEFHDAVVLAERIDGFLAVLERGGPGAPLARDCRHHLDLLLVLADWCQDAGQARAAAEARHLHALACALQR